MSRLTNHFDYCDFANCKWKDTELAKVNQCNFFNVTSRDRCHDKQLYERLRYYENLEEQGRLVETQYMVGETVWCLKEDYDYDWDAVGYKFMGICGDYIIVTSEYMGMTFKEQLDEMCEEIMEDENPSIYIFHKSRVFLTKEEAEAKLAEMESK